uniref:Uncharacterized protein n=1 Tax=Octopus bimaculoides TaxID=37653 RepID=A0A0L8FQJ3_OCTBM
MCSCVCVPSRDTVAMWSVRVSSPLLSTKGHSCYVVCPCVLSTSLYIGTQLQCVSPQGTQLLCGLSVCPLHFSLQRDPVAVCVPSRDTLLCGLSVCPLHFSLQRDPVAVCVCLPSIYISQGTPLSLCDLSVCLSHFHLSPKGPNSCARVCVCMCPPRVSMCSPKSCFIIFFLPPSPITGKPTPHPCRQSYPALTSVNISIFIVTKPVWMYMYSINIVL